MTTEHALPLGSDVQRGAVVVLKSGGPNMLISQMTRDHIVAIWIDNDGRLKTGTFAKTNVHILPVYSELVTQQELKV